MKLNDLVHIVHTQKNLSAVIAVLLSFGVDYMKSQEVETGIDVLTDEGYTATVSMDAGHLDISYYR